jgi:hypothetical protein
VPGTGTGQTVPCRSRAVFKRAVFVPAQRSEPIWTYLGARELPHVACSTAATGSPQTAASFLSPPTCAWMEVGHGGGELPHRPHHPCLLLRRLLPDGGYDDTTCVAELSSEVLPIPLFFSFFGFTALPGPICWSAYTASQRGLERVRLPGLRRGFAQQVCGKTRPLACITKILWGDW